MPAKQSFSKKRLQIDKANSAMVAVIAGASFVMVFSIFACKALLSQRSYQGRVISKKETAVDQLKQNITAVATLTTAYKGFTGTSQNVLGGDPNGKGEKDGDNAKIILDALPSKYDFPALTNSLEKIITNNKMKIEGLTGTDDEVAQSSKEATATPVAVDMPFEVSVSGKYSNVQKLISVFEHSIRPFNIDSMDFSGKDSDLKVTIKAKTYYQQEKAIKIETEVVQ